MNAVEIEEAVSKLIEQAFDATEFPYLFLEAFGNKAATIKRLRSSGKNTTNKSDINRDGVVTVLQRNNIHLATCDGGGPDAVASLLDDLVESAATTKHKAKFALATDGESVHAACLNSDEPPLVCEYKDLGDHFGYFLELAGISTVRQIRENAFDIKATGRLNRLYLELLRNNPDWDGDQRREDLNHFFARLIFCFFAEDTGIFRGNDLFTETVRQMSESSGENTHFVLSEIFRAMDVPMKERKNVNLRSWAGQFPYVNGGLFGGGTTEDDVPKFTQIARSYLLHIGSLDWTQINPDIFGSMIQAVAEDEERGALGMHYTSVPNILKVLNPLFLDDLENQLEEAGKNARKLLNLRKRMARIRVFDPACGSGNFLVVAYKQMRRIESEINILRGEPDRPSEIPLTNFRGIEIRHFAAEVARLALVIAEYQCDELHRGQRLALAEFLPLDNQNWITHGNALRLNWTKLCPPEGASGVKLTEDDLFETPLDQAEIDFENEGGETYICGNPPYVGDKTQTKEQKAELQLFKIGSKKVRSVDYVAGWFWKASDYIHPGGAFAFVATNSVCQGVQVPLIWPRILSRGQEIAFAHRTFYWGNNAARNAQVTCVIVGVRSQSNGKKFIYTDGEKIEASHINAYLAPGSDTVVERQSAPISKISTMFGGNIPRDSGNFFLNSDERKKLLHDYPESQAIIRRILGSKEFINGLQRYCLWIEDHQKELAESIPPVAARLEKIREYRLRGSERGKAGLNTPHRFERTIIGEISTIVVPSVSSERREYLPCGLLQPDVRVSNLALAIYDAPLWNLAIVASKIHLAWVATICGKLKTDYRYSNTLGWNTFPVPPLSDQNKSELANCAEGILIAREDHWPATIAELYDPEKMPHDLRAAHDRNDETLERIYIGRRFKNDTERLEALFQMYTEMTKGKTAASENKK